MALRSGAPIVPMAICGAETLYRGKRIIVRILPPTTAPELLGASWSVDPQPGTRAELQMAHALTDAIAARIDAALGEAYPRTVDPPDHPRRWTWLTRLFR
jgi:1-acyl-sn-glycerol-3-phosphate acyltransferase